MVSCPMRKKSICAAHCLVCEYWNNGTGLWQCVYRKREKRKAMEWWMKDPFPWQ